MIYIGTWNIIGLNSIVKQAEVRNWIHKHGLTVIGLIETRVKKKNSVKVANRIGNRFSHLDNYSSHPNGRIWVLWDDSQVDICLIQQSSQFIHCKIQPKHSQSCMLITFIYASNDEPKRSILWVDSHCSSRTFLGLL